MQNSDAAMHNPEHSPNEVHTEESMDHLRESHGYDAASSGRADLAYGNDLHLAANQLQYCKCSSPVEITFQIYLRLYSAYERYCKTRHRQTRGKDH
jgi:hypothetical protein